MAKTNSSTNTGSSTGSSSNIPNFSGETEEKYDGTIPGRGNGGSSGSSSSGSSSGGSSGGSGNSGGSGGGGGGTSAADAAAAAAAAAAARSTQLRKEKDQAIAKDAFQAQKEARESAPKASQADSSVGVTPTVNKQNQEDKVNPEPQLKYGQGLHGAGYVDSDTGEVVTTSLPNMDPFFEAPGTPENTTVKLSPAAAFNFSGSQVADDPIVADDALESMAAATDSTVDTENPIDEAVANAAEDVEAPLTLTASAKKDYREPEEPVNREETQQEQEETNFTPESSGSVFYDQTRNESEEERKSRKKREREIFNNRNRNNLLSGRYDKAFPNEVHPVRESGLEVEFDPNSTESIPINPMDLNRQRNREAADLMQDEIKTGNLPAESRHIGPKGEERFSDVVENSINQIRHLYGCTRWTAKVLIRLRLGIGIDTKKKVFDEDYLEYEIPDSAIVMACAEIQRSQQLNGHPVGLVDSPPIILHNTYCFPVGVIPRQVARDMTREGALKDVSVSELVERAGKSWNNYTLPMIRANLKGDSISQRWAIENMVRAVCNLDGVDSEQYMVANDIPRCFNEIMEQNRREAAANPDMADVYEYQNEQHQKVLERFMRMRGRKPIKDKNGAILGYNKRSKTYNVFIFGVNAMKLAGIAGHVPIIATGAVEKAVGNLQSKLLDWGFYNSPFLSEEERTLRSKYIMTDKTKQGAMTDEAKDSVGAAFVLLHAGGIDGIKLFTEAGYSMTTKEVNRFIADATRAKELKKNQDEKSSISEVFDKFSDATVDLAQKVSDIFVPGDFILKGATTLRFFENLHIAQCAEATEGRPSLTNTEIEEAVSFGENIPQFISQVLSTDAGREALITTKNTTMDRINPLTHLIDVALRRHGVTNALVTASIDTYVRYGSTMLQLMVPFSNSLSYLAVRGANKIKGGEDLESLNYQIGGHYNFWRGFAKNFVYDAVKFNNIALIALIGYGAIKALGGLTDPPEEKKYNLDEYLIGGMAIHTTWIMNDLLGFGWAMSVAMAVQEQHPDEPDRVLGVFLDGCADMISGSSIIDAISFVKDYREHIANIEEMFNNPDFEKPENWDSECVKMFLWGLGANVIGKITPVFLKMQRDTLLVGDDAFDRDPFKVFDRSPEGVIATPGEGEALSQDERYKTKYAGALDSYRRRLAIKNGPILGILFNWFCNGYLFDDGTTEKTGYLFEEMPIDREKDPVRSMFCEITRLDMNMQPDGTPEEVQAWKDAHAANLLKWIDDLPFSSVEEALANNFMIEPTARINAINYCYDQINLLKLRYVEELEMGMYPDYESSYAAQTKMQQNQRYYYDMLDEWLQNDQIPWRDDGYGKLISDTQQIYTWPDGTPANAWDAFWNPAVKTRYVPFGNHPTSFLPFTIRDVENEARNGEERSGTYNESLNAPDKLRLLDTDINPGLPKLGFANYEIPYGSNKGRKLGNVVFGDGTQNPGVPSSGLRAVKPLGNNTPPDAAKEATLESSANRLGIDLDDLDTRMKNSWNNSSGSGWRGSGWSSRNYRAYNRYYGSGGAGGSGSSYNPKIYSNAKAVNADRAATMYTKQPYGPTISYLRPNFSTKGSREAYKRSDM